MWKINEAIKPIEDHRTIYEVDCIARPHGILLDSLEPGIYDSFQYYLACAKCYQFIHKLDPYVWPIGVYQFTTQQLKFQYHFHTCESTSELHSKLRIALDNGEGVIVPCNIRKLFYSWSYPNVPALHMYLVTGYNAETKVYSIIDNMQNLNHPIPIDTDISGNFTYFHLREETLDECWNAMEEIDVPLYKNKIVTISKPETIERPDEIKMLKYLTDFRNLKFEPQNYREIEVFESTLQAFREMNLPRDGRERYFRFQMVFDCKKFLFSQISKLIERVGTDSDLLNSKNLMNEISAKWLNYKNIFYLHFMRNEIETVYELSHVYQPIIQLEEQLMSMVGEIVDKYEQK